VYGVGGSQIRLFFDFFWLNDFVNLWRTDISRIKDVNPAGTLTWNYQEASGFIRIAVARTASIPTKVMEFIADVGHWGAMNDLRVGGRVGVNVYRCEIIRLFNTRTGVKGYCVKYLFLLGFHGGFRGSVAWTTAGVVLLIHLINLLRLIPQLLSRA
jgi:hypothetical protein